jgi:anthranilate phosphoribosyltransferase
MPPTDAVSRAIHALADREDLTAELAEAAFGQVMRGEASPVQMSALLVGLRTKGETAAEVMGAVRALRSAMLKVEVPAASHATDTCGTGGGRVGTFNISTAAAIVATGAGARIAKHGNRSFTSQSGSADVLEALGVPIPANPEQAAAMFAGCGMTFLFAPHFHPAMRFVGPVRRELGLTTVMNILGPLANPAGVRRQVVGVADAERAALIADALAGLDCERALVVHARAGMDEIAPVGATDVWEVADGQVRTWKLEPDDWGLPAGSLDELAGGDPEHNADLASRILSGEDRGVRRSAVVINAAAALVVAGVAKDWKDGLARAGAALDDGRAMEVLERLRGVSTSESRPPPRPES